MNVCQPDIALLDANGNVFAVIEVVVTHQPEENVLQYYEANNIVLIQINLTSEEDLNNVEGKIKTPDIVDYCYLNPKCSEYGRFPLDRKIAVYPARCSRCYSLIEKYYIETTGVFGRFRSLDFLENEINFVKSKKSDIEVRKNRETGETYPIYSCWNCKRIASRGRRVRWL